MRKIVLFFLVLLVAAVMTGCGKKEQVVENEPSSVTEVSSEDPKTAPLPEIDESKLTTTKSGLQYYDVVVGEGISPKAGNVAVMEYTGWLKNGKVFDTSKGREPFVFTVGHKEVISAWDEAVLTMKAGGKRLIVAPSELAYGEDGRPPVIGPNETLIFEMELKDVITGE